MRKTYLFLLFMSGIGMMLSGTVAAVITPTIDDYSSYLTIDNRQVDNCRNGSGLTGDGSAGSTHAVGDGGITWTTSGSYSEYGGPDYDPYVTLDLGAVYDVNTIREWGCNSIYSYFGPNEVDVYTSTNGVDFTSAGTVYFAEAPALSTYTGNEIAVNYSGVRYIKLDFMNNYDGAVFDGTGTNGGADGRSLAQLSEIRFEGTALSPVISGHPVALTVAAGDTAVYSVTATNTSDYQWRKDGGDVSDGPTGSGATISGAETATLTITNVQEADEGDYTCMCTGGGVSIESDGAQLLTKRLIGHWKFEGDLLDDEGDKDGSGAGDLTYVAGIVDLNALEFGAGASTIVNLTGTEDYYNFPPRGYTASLWVKTDEDTSVASLFSKYDVDGFSTYRDGLTVISNLENTVITSTLTADEWNFVAVTYDVDPNTLTLHVNGLPVSSESGVLLGDTSASGVVANIGGPDAGQIDDVKIYSYAVATVDIAQEYADISGNSVCLNRPELDIAPVGAPDCVVDVKDLAEWAKAWLGDGNIYPTP